MTQEPEWHQGQPVPDGWTVIAKLGRLWSSVPHHERATKEHWNRDNLPSPGDYMWANYQRVTSEPQCEIAVSTLHLTEWRNGLWLPCQGDVYDDGRRCPRHGGPRKPPSEERRSLTSLRRENEELRRQVKMLAVAQELTAKIDRTDPVWQQILDGLPN